MNKSVIENQINVEVIEDKENQINVEVTSRLVLNIPSYTSTDIGKVLKVAADGLKWLPDNSLQLAHTAGTSREMAISQFGMTQACSNLSGRIESISNVVSNNSSQIDFLNGDVEFLKYQNADNVRKVPLFMDFTTKEVNSINKGNINSYIFYSIPSKCFCMQIGSSEFTKDWPDSDVYNSNDRDGLALRNKLFMDYDGSTYYFDGNDLRPVFDEVTGSYTTMELKAMMLRRELLPGYWYRVENYLDYDEESLTLARASIANRRAGVYLLIKAESPVAFSKRAKFTYITEPTSGNNSLEDWEVDYDIFGKGYALTNYANNTPAMPTYLAGYTFVDIDVTLFDSPLGVIYQLGLKREFDPREYWGFARRAGTVYTMVTDIDFDYDKYLEYAPEHCGVVTRMKDHRGNEAPFDFYSIALEDGTFVLPFDTDYEMPNDTIVNNTIKPCVIGDIYLVPQVSIEGDFVSNNIIEVSPNHAPIIINGTVVDNIIYNSVITECVNVCKCNIINSTLQQIPIVVERSLFNNTVINGGSGVISDSDIEGGIFNNCLFTVPRLKVRNEFNIEKVAIDKSGHATSLGITPFTPSLYIFTVNGHSFYTEAHTTWVEFVTKENNSMFVITSDSVMYQNRRILYTKEELADTAVRPTDPIIGIDVQASGYRI